MATLAIAASLDADLALLEKHAVPTRDLIAFYRKRLAASEAEREDAMQRVIDVEVRRVRARIMHYSRARAHTHTHSLTHSRNTHTLLTGAGRGPHARALRAAVARGRGARAAARALGREDVPL